MRSRRKVGMEYWITTRNVVTAAVAAVGLNDDDVRCEVCKTSSVFMIIIVRCILLLKN